MALQGYRSQSETIAQRIAQLRKQLKSPRAMDNSAMLTITDSQPARPKRALSAKARRAIGAAQKKRWAAFHRAQRAKKKPQRASAVGGAAA